MYIFKPLFVQKNKQKQNTKKFDQYLNLTEVTCFHFEYEFKLLTQSCFTFAKMSKNSNTI